MMHFSVYLYDPNLSRGIHRKTLPLWQASTLHEQRDAMLRVWANAEDDRSLPCIPSEESRLLGYVHEGDDLPAKHVDDPPIYWDTDRYANVELQGHWKAEAERYEFSLNPC